MEWRVIPYDIFGAKLFAVENFGGYIKKYCDSRDDAQEYCDQLNCVNDKTNELNGEDDNE
tara:strand:- start:313 stop:492 length:180 start_codon:yes stop_codon:yes gene_type:complete